MQAEAETDSGRQTQIEASRGKIKDSEAEIGKQKGRQAHEGSRVMYGYLGLCSCNDPGLVRGSVRVPHGRAVGRAGQVRNWIFPFLEYL